MPPAVCGDTFLKGDETVNRHRFKSDMEAAWELRPFTDETPESRSHINRFSVPKREENSSKNEKMKENTPKN